MPLGTISNAYNDIVTRVTALFPNHRRLPHPYELEENNVRYLEKGFGIRLASTENSNFFISDVRSAALSFEVPLTRRYFAMEHDALGPAVAEKELLDDLALLIDDAHTNNLQVSNVIDVTFDSAGGIERIRAEKSNIIAMVPAFTCRFTRT